MLADRGGRKEDRDRGRGDEHERPGDRGRHALQAGHLGVERQQARDGGGGAPPRRGRERAVGEVGDGELGGDHGPGLAEPGGQHEHSSAAPGVGDGEHDQRDRGEDGEDGHGVPAALAPAALATERDQQDAGGRPGDGQAPAASQPLAQTALGERDEQAEAEHERGLHDAERREVEGEQLQQEAADDQRGAAEPAPPLREPQEQPRVVGARRAGVARLHDVAELEADGGRDAAGKAGGDPRGSHWDNAGMTARSWSGVALAAAAGWSAPALSAHFPSLCDMLGVRRRNDGDGATVHLTFDDGPHPEGTLAILEALAARRATATFFLVGEQVERFPAVAREIVAAGHVVALHGHRHRSQLRVPPRALADDLRRASDVIASTTGRLAPLYRPPYGIFSSAGLALAQRRGDDLWLWSRWGRDWRRAATARSIAQLAAGELDRGDVILLHDADHYADAGSWRATAGAVPLILDAIEARGLRTAAL